MCDTLCLMSHSRVVNIDNFQQFTAINVLSDPGHLGGPLVIPNAIQVLLSWGLLDGHVAHNVLYATVSGAFTATAAVANAIGAALTTGSAWTGIQTFLNPAPAFFGNVTLRDVRSPNQPVIVGVGLNAVGTSPSTSLPDENAICVTFRTALTGNANRGRMYVPNFAANAVGAGGVIAASLVTSLTTWANTIPTAFTAQGMTFVLAHPARAAYTGVTGTAHPARPAGTVPITSISVRDNHWDTQRRRGLK
jgi:hypothetical protein